MYESDVYRIKAKNLVTCTIMYLNGYIEHSSIKDNYGFSFDARHASIFIDIDEATKIFEMADSSLNCAEAPDRHMVYIQVQRDTKWDTIWHSMSQCMLDLQYI